MVIDDEGNVTMKGSVTLGAGSIIEWTNIDETDSSAYKKANSAYDHADSAYSNANSAKTIAKNIANGVYSGGTFINGTTIYSPKLSGEELVLSSIVKNNTGVYNYLHLTPTSMYLKNAYNNSDTEKTKFFVDLGSEKENSTLKMRLGAGVNEYGGQALWFEKLNDEIRIGTYVSEKHGVLDNFAGMKIIPSTGKVTFTGTVQAVAVFG